MTDTKPDHESISATPPDEKERHKLEGMYAELSEHCQNVFSALHGVVPIDNSTTEQISPNVLMVSINASEPAFKGLLICPHCMMRAAFLLRDLAGICETIAAEAEKHRK